MKICLVCSAGGHLFQLFSLKDAWKYKEHFWVSFPTRDVKSLLKDKHVYWAHFPTNRNVKNFFKNLLLAYRIISSERPDCIFSTGAGIAVPFILIGWIFQIKTIYIESVTRIDRLSLSGLLCYPLATKFLVQWPELAGRFKKAEYHGRVF